MKEMVQTLIENISSFAGDYLISIIIGAFIGAVMLRALIYFTVTRHQWFAKEFEKRVDRFVENATKTAVPNSFYVLSKRLLEKTYYENFEMRSKLRRRKPDRRLSVALQR